MDNYLITFREMLSLRGLSDHILKGYCTYIRAYLDYLEKILHKLPEDVSWQAMVLAVLSAPLTGWEVYTMHRLKIQQVFDNAWKVHAASFCPSPVQIKAASSILACKSGKLGCNVSVCTDCGHMAFHNNSCRNRNCLGCQALLKEFWIDKRKAEVIDAPYFHVVFIIPAQLNPLVYANQDLLYSLLHKCCAQTFLELAADSRFLGAAPGILQVLHTWGQELNIPTSTVSFPGPAFPKTGSLRCAGAVFLSRLRFLPRNFAVSSFPHWIPFTRLAGFPFPFPAPPSRILLPGLHLRFPLQHHLVP